MKLLALVIVLGGCELFIDVPNASLAAGGSNGVDGGGSGGMCSSSAPCTSPTPVCDTAVSTCVECVTSPDCTTPGRAICDGDVCRGCRADADCTASNVCLTDGTCADPARVLYASSTGTAALCTLASPCTFDTAYSMVSVTQDIIKLAAGSYDRTAPLAVMKNVIVTGEGATFQNASAQAFLIMFDVMGVSLTVLNATFALANTASGTNAYAAECLAAGSVEGALHFSRVHLMNGDAGAYASSCVVSLDRSVVDGNLFYGMYLVGSQITITNSFITNNGSTTTSGGIVLSAGTIGTIDHVTLSANTSTMGAHALSCTDGSVTIRSSIISGNGTPSIDATCVIGHSVVDADYIGGANNVATDPKFVAPATRDFHIMPGSPAVGLADPASLQVIDFDGDPRPSPTGSMADSGADEIP